MQLRCNQVVVTPIIDEDYDNAEDISEILQGIKAKRMIFAGSVRRGGSVTKYDQLRITSINEELIDLIAIGSGQTLSIKQVPMEDIVSVSITLNNAVDAEEVKEISLNDILDIGV